MSIEIKWAYWNMTNPEEIMKMFRTMNKQDIVPGIEEFVEQEKTHISEPEDPLTVHIISEEGESVRHN